MVLTVMSELFVEAEFENKREPNPGPAAPLKSWELFSESDSAQRVNLTLFRVGYSSV